VTQTFLEDEGVELTTFGESACSSMMGDSFGEVEITVSDVRSGSVLIEHSLRVDAENQDVLANAVEHMKSQVGTNYTYTGADAVTKTWMVLSYEAANSSETEDEFNVTEPLFSSNLEIYIFAIAVSIAVCILGALLLVVHYTMRSKRRREADKDQKYLASEVMMANPPTRPNSETPGGPNDHSHCSSPDRVTDFTGTWSTMTTPAAMPSMLTPSGPSMMTIEEESVPRDHIVVCTSPTGGRRMDFRESHRL